MDATPRGVVKVETLYQTLGVARTASAEEIKKAYRKKLLQDHPDKGGSKATFQRVKAAFDVLGDENRRSLYDQCGFGDENKENAGKAPKFVTPSRRERGLSGEIKTPTGRRNVAAGDATPTRRGRGNDVKFPLKVSLEELYTGHTKKLRINRTVVCGSCRGCGANEGSKSKAHSLDLACITCGGSGVRVFEQASHSAMRGAPTTYQQMQTVCSRCKGLGVCIPEDQRCTTCHGKRTVVSPTLLEVPVRRGARQGERITLKGCSNERPGVAAGDVIVSVAPQKHSRFIRKGDNLCVRQRLSLSDAFHLGRAPKVRFVIDQLDGRQIAVEMANDGEPIRPGSVRTLHGEGMPIPKTGNEGEAGEASAGTSTLERYEYGSMEVNFDVKDFPIGFDKAKLDEQEIILRSQLWESRPDTTLLAAADARVADVLRLLTATKGGLKEDPKQGQLRDGWGRSALHLSAESETVEQFLADNRPVDSATVTSDEPMNVIGALLLHGAVVDDRDVWASTPLHLACRKLHELVVAELLDYGADIDAPNSQGATPMDELTRAEESAAAASQVQGDGSGAQMWLRAERVRQVVSNHLDRKLLQRIQVLAWVSGCVSYRLGRFSAMALQLPPAVIERISRMIAVAPSAGGGGGVVNLRNTVGGGTVTHAVLKRFVTEQLALQEAKEVSIEKLSIAGTEEISVDTASGGGLFGGGKVTVYKIEVVTSIGKAAGRSVGGGGIETHSIHRRYTEFEQLHSEVLHCSERGRLTFEHGDRQHRRTLNAALINLQIPEKRLWHSNKVVQERLHCFRVYLDSLRSLALHSQDLRSVLLNWLQL
jgi:DnaJ family protein A protein 2